MTKITAESGKAFYTKVVEELISCRGVDKLSSGIKYNFIGLTK
jgi:hypothetical protein